jgi:hypothetical protein
MTFLREFLSETIKEEIVKFRYLMIDETCELVGGKKDAKDAVSYDKKYMWAFKSSAKRLTYLHALDIINRMTELFVIEYECKERKLSSMKRKQYRLKHSQPIASAYMPQ